MNYSVDYFIAKLSAIPEELWCTHFFVDGNKKCVLGHLGCRPFPGINVTQESMKITNLLGLDFQSDVVHINDYPSARFNQQSPKARILAALQAAKAKAL